MSALAPAIQRKQPGLLTQVGVEDTAVTTEMLGTLADACRTSGTAVEISEAWRSPSPRIIAELREVGVPLIAASDARYAAEVGSWQYLRRV